MLHKNKAIVKLTQPHSISQELWHARLVLCMPYRRLPLLASLSNIFSAASVPAPALLVSQQLDHKHQCVLNEQTYSLFKPRGTHQA